MARPSSVLKVVSITLAAILTISTVVIVWVLALRDRRWAAMETRVQELKTGLQAVPLKRVPLGRPVLPGNAWDDYLAPDIGNGPLHIPLKTLLFLRRDPKAHAKEVEELVTKHHAWIELIRSAAHRETAVAPDPRRIRDRASVIKRAFLGLGDALSLCLARSRLLAEHGDIPEALDLLMDVLLCSRDMAETRVLMGYDALFSMNQALYELRDIVGTRPINPETLHELDRRLALLDQHFPEGASRPLANLLSFGEELLENDRREGGWNLRSPDGPERRWRTFYSARLQAATVFEAADRLAMQAAALETESWAVAGPRIQSIEQEMRDFPDSRLRYGIINITSAQFTRRTRSLLRLIHVGTHYRATGESSTLDDPVGDVLQTRLTDDSFMAWSRSPSSGEELPPRKGIRVYESNANITVPLRK